MSTYLWLNLEEGQENNSVRDAEVRRNSLLRFNVVEWQVVHFYEHTVEFTNEL